MKIRDQEWNECKCCGRNTTIKVNEAYGCDQCGKEIDLNKKNIEYLESVIFSHAENRESKRVQFCSWKCCLKFLKKTKTDYFISLPYLNFENKQKGIHARDFFKLVKP
jgi:hypothetical protein